ncbi:MAG: hypothetical protein RR346_12155 [Bacteroidales bacterium]
MKNQVLSIEQMQRLKDLGIDTSKASVIRVSVFSDYPDFEMLGASKGYTKSAIKKFGRFTLQDILEILPSEICDDYNGTYYLKAVKNSMGFWRYMYAFATDVINNNCHAKPNIEAAYETLVWCAENGYLKGDAQ